MVIAAPGHPIFAAPGAGHGVPDPPDGSVGGWYAHAEISREPGLTFLERPPLAERFGFGEIFCPSGYFEEASSINFRRSVTCRIGVLAHFPILSDRM